MGRYIPTIEDAQEAFRSVVAVRGDHWERRTSASAPIWEAAAKAPEAEEAYATGVQMAVQHRLRLRGLEPWTGAAWAGMVRAKGRYYQEKAAGAAPKWGMKFKPFLEEIRRIVPGLPARVPGDIVGNITRRVTPIATRLHELKVGGAGYSPASPAPAFGASPAAGPMPATPPTYPGGGETYPGTPAPARPY